MSYSALVFFLMVAIFHSPEGYAGCQLHVYVKNGGKNKVAVYNNPIHPETGVRNKTGTWIALVIGGWFKGDSSIDVQPSETKGDVYSATFSCSAHRRYRIKYQCVEGPYTNSYFTTYYPSADGYTTEQNVTILLTNCQ